MTQYLIYKLTSPSNKAYIGQTKQKRGVNERFTQHVLFWKKWIKKERPRSSYQTKLFYAFDKYDPSLWKRDILNEVYTQEEANNEEIKFIELYNSVLNGYNVQLGGQGWARQNLTKEHKEAISDARKKYWNTPEGIAWKEELSKRYTENNPGGNAQRGKIPWNKGLICPTISKSKKGINLNLTDEQKIKKSKKTTEMWNAGKYNNRPPMTEENRRKVSERRKGVTTSDNQKKAAREKMQKKWIVTSPLGVTQEIVNLRQFAKENNFTAENIITYGHTKGWKGHKIL